MIQVPGLARRGYAHSSEIWRAGRLVGGVYGVRLGRAFFGESMFSLERDASKAALAGLVRQSIGDGTELIDCQLPSEHLRSLGSRALPRSDFLAWLGRAIGTGADAAGGAGAG